SELTVRAGDKTIVHNVSFGFPRGKTLAILGPSGCGKSTTLKAIVGENPDFEGDVSVFGLNPRKDKATLKYVVGYVPQDTQLYENMTVAENIAYFGSQYGLSKKDLQTRVPQILKVLGLEERANLNVKSLSGGQQRRASIGATLVFNPQLLILDEPTSGLDPVTRRNLWSFLKQINRELNVSVIVTTHFLDEADLADHILILNRGKVAAEGTPEGLKRDMPGGGKAMTVELFTPAEQMKDKLDRVVERLLQGGHIAATDRAGYFLKLYATNPQAHTREVLDALSAEGVPFSGLDIVDATLEDVFVYTTGEKFVVKSREA
ncbi:MAG TPA: ABC transporter ATP-binding protein, partial [Candidatus Thermoplasmatota archaeon]|nr:ABC transporter ATP-binding protein [Candidatus Thermoplasmatota archaeon]